MKEDAMDHYLWCTNCDIIKPKIKSHPEPSKDHVWVCRNCGKEVAVLELPKGSNPVNMPTELIKLLMDYEEVEMNKRKKTRKAQPKNLKTKS